MQTPLTAVFDLDGTLAHTSPDIAAALNATLATYGKEFSVAETERMVGGGLRNLLLRALESTGISLSKAETDATFDRLLAHYRASPVVLSRLHDWVFDVLKDFHDQGARIAVCSNKAEDIVIEILERLDAARWVHAAIGSIDGRPRKPDPEPLVLSIREAGGETSRAIMVGDLGADVGAARAAGIPVILVPHGYGSRLPEDLDADRIVATAPEMRAAILELTGGAA